jgi:hypothetical protein
MPRGGKREGAGRKEGSATVRTREIADRAASEGILPLEVMLIAMRMHAGLKEWDAAAEIAKYAAPYLHPRLTAIAMAFQDRLVTDITDAELRLVASGVDPKTLGFGHGSRNSGFG